MKLRGRVKTRCSDAVCVNLDEGMPALPFPEIVFESSTHMFSKFADVSTGWSSSHAICSGTMSHRNFISLENLCRRHLFAIQFVRMALRGCQSHELHQLQLFCL